MHELMNIASWCSPLILIIGVALGSYYYTSLDKKELLVFWFLISSLIIDLFSRFQGWFMSHNNLTFFSLSAIVELVFFSTFYLKHLLHKEIKYLNFILLGCGIIILLNFGVYYFDFKIKEFQSFDRFFVNLVILCFSILFLKQQLTSQRDVLTSNSVINTFVLLYITVDIFIALTMNFMVNADINIVTFFWLLRLTFLILLYANLSYTIWQNGKRNRFKHYG